MWYLIISILLNTSLLVILRFFAQYGINNLFAIVTNYIVCFVISTLITKGQTLQLGQIPDDWWPWLLLMGLLFIFTFNMVALTVQILSVTVATLMQRISLVLVVLYAIMVHAESYGLIKILGLALGILSVVLITGLPDCNKKKDDNVWYIALLPALVCLFSGWIDINFFEISIRKLTDGREMLFGGWLFGAAAVLGILFILLFKKGEVKNLRQKDILAGIILGVPNFFSVFYIQKMLSSGMEGSFIYPIHNIGILFLAATLSFVLFKEKFSWMKVSGLVAASIAIAMLAMQMNN